MQIYISDKKVVTEAITIITEVYDAEELEKVIMKLLRHYKYHTDVGNGGWYEIAKYANLRYSKEKELEVT